MVGVRWYSCPKNHLIEAIVAASIVLLLTVPARCELHLAAGDTLEISVAGVPELNQRVVIQPDGSISFPLLGTIRVAGLTPAKARATIESGLAAKVFRKTAADGSERAIVIVPDQVTATVAEFRPIFVDGDVAKPGQYKYQASMTVRQAVAMSGGYDMMRSHMGGDPFILSSDLRASYETQWTEFLKEQVAIWRIRNELGRQVKVDQAMLSKVPLPRSTIAEMMGLESEQLETQQANFKNENQFLQKQIGQTDDHIKVVSEELRLDEQAVANDTKDFEAISKLFDRKILPLARMADVRRLLLLSSTRKLQADSQLLKLKQSKIALSRQIVRLASKRKSDLLRELMDRQVRIDQIRAKLRSIDEKLQYTGILRSQFLQGQKPEAELVVIRGRGDRRQRLHVDGDFEVEPGDVIEVALRQNSREAFAK